MIRRKMNNGKSKVVLVAVVMALCMFQGCGKSEENVTATSEVVANTEKVKEEELDKEKKENTEIDTKKTESTKKEEAPNKKEEKQEEIEEALPEEKDDPTFSYASLSSYEFYFSSGVGGWATQMRIHQDGSFEGEFYDSDMGCTGEGYPEGTYYNSKFYGRFAELEKINDYTYATKIEYLDYYNEIGTEEIKNNKLYSYSTAYGLTDADRILFYLPGAPISALPEEYSSWVNYRIESDDPNAKQDFYGLYNEREECGFSGYAIEQTPLEIEIASIEKKEAQLLEGIEAMSQTEMNLTYDQIYTLWDGELNSIWQQLRTTLDREAMNLLIQEEKEWIAYKEAEVKKACEACEGGSMEPMIQFSVGAMLTKHRVYVLAQYFTNGYYA